MSDPEERDGPDLCVDCEHPATREVDGEPLCSTCRVCEWCDNPHDVALYDLGDESLYLCVDCYDARNDCPTCGGSGGGEGPWRCPSCRGTGRRRAA